MKLIDVLCALSISVLCIPPLLHFQYSLHTKQRELIERRKQIVSIYEEKNVNTVKELQKGIYENYFTE